jgi:hypothetical protein
LIVGQAKHTPVPHRGQDEPSLSTSISSSIWKNAGVQHLDGRIGRCPYPDRGADRHRQHPPRWRL